MVTPGTAGVSPYITKVRPVGLGPAFFGWLGFWGWVVVIVALVLVVRLVRRIWRWGV